jgi:hypothetical protein
MAIQLIGGSSGDIPFNRTFFNVTLGEMIDESGKAKPVRLTVFLSDGTTLDVCTIDDLSDSYLALKAYQGETENMDPSVHLIPYGLIYRIEISPKNEESSRVGFHFRPPLRKAVTARRSK